MHSGIKYSFGNHSDVGKKRKINQDSFGTAKNDWGEIFIVADGMGGHKGGEVASKITVDHMCNAFKIASKDTPPAVFLERTINSANDTVLAKAQEGPEYESMGTTIVAVIIKDNEAHIAHVGDSRLYLFRYNQPFFKTKDHSFVQDLVDQGLISETEAETHPNKNRILQAIGTGQVKPDITTQTLYKGDHILICSDGLSGEVNETELFNELKSSKPMEASKNLVDLANERGGPDNITVIVIHIDKGEKPPKKPKPDVKNQIVLDPMSPSPNRVLAIGLILGILLSFIGYMTYQHFKRPKINIIVSGGPKTVKSKLPDTTATLVDTVMLNDSSVIELNNPKQSSNQATEKTNAATVSKKEEIEQKNIQDQEKNKIGETKNDQSNGDED